MAHQRLNRVVAVAANTFRETVRERVAQHVLERGGDALQHAAVELDLAAHGRGFARPAGLGFPLEVTLTERRQRSLRFLRR